MMEVPKGLRLHIAFFGNRNVGKSSLLNALAGQNVAIVSDTPGTTTDPVEKTLEIARQIQKEQPALARSSSWILRV